LNRQIEELTEKLGRTPTLEEIHALNKNADRIFNSMRGTISLNNIIGEDSELESIVGEDRTEEFDTSHDADALLAEVKPLVSERDFNILIRRYGLDGDTPLTLSEAAETYGITRARIHQIEHKLLGKMRELATA